MTPVHRFLRGLLALFSSYGLAIVVLFLLFVLTGFGTWEQHYSSIYDVQRDYFESLVVVPSFFPIPLPGAYLLLSVLAVNLIVGGMVRIRKRVATMGVIVAHVGILMLLVGGFVEYTFSTKGSVALLPGDVKGAYESYFDWDVIVTEYLDDERGKAYVIPQEGFRDLDVGERARFTTDALPFDVELHGFQRNARPVRARGGGGVDGFMLKAMAPANPSEQNLPGVYVTLAAPEGASHKGLLWGASYGPYHVEEAGRSFGVALRRRAWELPFELRLERFVKSDHPGTAMAREYSSYVERIEDGVQHDVHITMNEPMRHAGYTFYQSSFIERRGRPTATVLSVVENPADWVPELAVWVIFVGLLLHFAMKLIKYIQAETKRKRNEAAR